MKKTFYSVAILTALIIAFSVFSVTAYAEETDNVTTNATESTEPTELSDTPTEETQNFGDVNGDNEVNTKDVLVLRKYSAQILTDDQINTKNADVNNDGIINIKDILLLRLYLSGANVELGKPIPPNAIIAPQMKIPTLVSVHGESETSVYTEFSGNGEFDSIELYRRAYNSKESVFVEEFTEKDTVYINKNLPSAVRYYYKVRAKKTVNGKTYYSDFSDEKYGTTPPVTPTGFNAAAASNTSIKLSWTKQGGVSGYYIYKQKQDGSYNRIADIAAGVTSYESKNLAIASTYAHKISAYVLIEGDIYESGKTTAKSVYTKNSYTKYVAGKSYQGRDINAYVFNENASKTMLLTFEVHGFEDSYAKDGQVLVDCANSLINYYNKNPGKLNGRRLVIIPSCNPDGVIAGKNNLRECADAFGRCTANHIDINRDFGAGHFKAKETQAIKAVFEKYKPTWSIDFHGWENSVIGDSTIGKAFMKNCGITTDKTGSYGTGKRYMVDYAHNSLKVAHAALVEFPSPSKVNASQVQAAINQILA